MFKTGSRQHILSDFDWPEAPPQDSISDYHGLYKFNAMSFELTNAIFQTLMNDIFRDLLDVRAIVYLDDIFVYSKSEEREQQLRQVRRQLKNNQFYVKRSKRIFLLLSLLSLATSIDYFGHIADGEELRPIPWLVQTLTDFLCFKTPKNSNHL